jgi:triosephosphate isomerase
VKSEIAIIAYEPRWAIGTGLAIEPSEAQQMHDYIAREMRGVPICYGGSVSDKNIYAFLSLENTEGVLVGSSSTTAASLQAMFKRV